MLKRLFLTSLLVNIVSFQYATTKDIWVTVFIHGSFSLKPHLNISNIVKMLNDTIEESVYYRSTEINRRDPFFYKNQAMGELGLHKIDITRPSKITASPTVAAAFEQMCQFAGYPASDEYYTFGWSGLVSNKLRYIEAGFLYKDLTKIIKQFQKQGHNPLIRILGYSHGGNLALQLGAIHQTKNPNDKISIEEFHLIGTPIQIETDYLITSPIFKRIYNWYSRGDNVQSLDFFSFKRFFSKKKFSKRKSLTLPEKLTQIRIKISHFIPKKCTDIDFVPTSEKERRKCFKEINFDPGHFELWFMGWTTLRYRQEFPMNPLPFIVFIPLLTQYINSNPNTPHDIVAYIQPSFHKVELYPYWPKNKKWFHLTFPFIDSNVLSTMKNCAKQYNPENYNIEIYNRKVYDAIRIVDHELSTIKKLTKLEKKNKKIDSPIIKIHHSCDSYNGHLPTLQK
ncbi:hypothetical protein HYV11_01405 [Candidatus Dependentiae bacterium]|nr:hypothetical protein [Candidatus Dependentiae bacterium]